MSKTRVSSPWIEDEDLKIIKEAAKIVSLDLSPFLVSSAKTNALKIIRNHKPKPETLADHYIYNGKCKECGDITTLDKDSGLCLDKCLPF